MKAPWVKQCKGLSLLLRFLRLIAPPLCVPATSQLFPTSSLVTMPQLLSQCDQPRLDKYFDMSRQEMTVPRHPTLSGVEQALNTPCVISSSDNKVTAPPPPRAARPRNEAESQGSPCRTRSLSKLQSGFQ